MKNKQNTGPVSSKKKGETSRGRRFQDHAMSREFDCLSEGIAKKDKPVKVKTSFPKFFIDMGFKLLKEVPDNWKPHSHNEDKQYLEFFRSFIYSYKFPSVLLYCILDKNPVKDICFYFLQSIASGKSFYKENKFYFNKSEAHHFLNGSSNSSTSFYKLFFESKCKARKLNHKLTNLIINVFADKFDLERYGVKFLDSYIDFLSRYPDYNWTTRDLGDVTDYVRHLLVTRQNFSFSGRTINSLVALSNEWHIHTQLINSTEDKSWAGFNIPDASITVHDPQYSVDYLYDFKQLKTSKDLINEGKKMRHCVGSYVNLAFDGRCAIFNCSCESASVCTIEVSSGKEILQARAKANLPPDAITMKAINIWAKNNGLRIRL